MRDGVSQVDGILGELNFANTTKEVCDEDAPRVPQEKVGTMAWSGHTLTLGAYFELWTKKHGQTLRKYTSTCNRQHMHVERCASIRAFILPTNSHQTKILEVFPHSESKLKIFASVHISY